MVIISFEVDEATLKKLDAHAKELDRSRSDTLRQILKEKLNWVSEPQRQTTLHKAIFNSQ